MLKKRLIFALLLDEGYFQLSRNFTLQSVGDLEWLYENYNLKAITQSVDELLLLNVGRGKKDTKEFSRQIIEITKKCFMPIAAGGGLRTIEDAYLILNSGADKLVVNTSLFTQQSYISELIKIFGSQSIVASIDYKRTEKGTDVFINNGTLSLGISIEYAISEIQKLNVGEIYLTSIEQDGTGQGLDLKVLSKATMATNIPIIASGGVGKLEHFIEGFNIPFITAVSTANIFNFIGDGLITTRLKLKQEKIPLAEWLDECN